MKFFQQQQFIDVNKELIENLEQKRRNINKTRVVGKETTVMMAPRKKKDQNAPIVEQTVRMATETLINDFMKDPEKIELSFPSDFDNTQRRYVHEYVKKFGLKSKSHGKGKCWWVLLKKHELNLTFKILGANRVLTVFKMTKNTQLEEDIPLECTESSLKQIFQLLKSNPLTNKEKWDIQKPLKADLDSQKLFPFRISVGQMNAPHLLVPPYPANLSQQTISQRLNLPIFAYRSQIIETIRNSRAVVISGETGSGKTTQVPQYLLEDASEHKIPYRIICTQPRRLSAISISERVAQERNEILGQTVGYQIRLESKISPSSNLIYCTNGVLLRCLMSDQPEIVFKHITHVIVDEVHERDKFSDFLLISLKRAMQVVPHIKVSQLFLRSFVQFSSQVIGDLSLSFDRSLNLKFQYLPFSDYSHVRHNRCWYFYKIFFQLPTYRNPWKNVWCWRELLGRRFSGGRLH